MAKGRVEASTWFRMSGKSGLFSAGWPSEFGALWSRPFQDLSAWDLARLEALALSGGLEAIDLHMRKFDARIDGIEVIGNQAVARLVGVRRRLPLTALGDGALRILDVALGIGAGVSRIALDEVDSGLHHSVLPQLWNVLRESSHSQIFASTHREECVYAAATCFAEAGDDSLRIIRLDRTDQGHRAVLYTPAEAREALDDGWELRG